MFCFVQGLMHALVWRAKGKVAASHSFDGSGCDQLTWSVQEKVATTRNASCCGKRKTMQAQNDVAHPKLCSACAHAYSQKFHIAMSDSRLRTLGTVHIISHAIEQAVSHRALQKMFGPTCSINWKLYPLI